MKKLKKILTISLITIAVIVLLLVGSTYLFRGKIFDLVKTEINKNIDAKVDFSGVNISFFRHFPGVSVGLDNLSVVGTEVFSADTLVSAKRLDVSVNILSFLKGDEMKINGIFIDAPRVHALINEDGRANWEIVKEDQEQKEEKSSEPFKLNLKKYEIRNGYVFYDDREARMQAIVSGLNHSGSGNFSDDIFTLVTSTRADEVTYYYGNIPFLFKVDTKVDADLEIDNKTNKYSFDNLTAFVNTLELKGKGFIQSLEEGYGMDINFSTAETDFKDILSLVPAIYKNDFGEIQTSGTASFAGRIKGNYDDNTMPGYLVTLDVKNGAFKYPDLPQGVSNVFIDAAVNNPDGKPDNTVVNVKEAKMNFGDAPFTFRLLLKNPLSDMFVDAAAKGKLDLNQVTKFVKLEEGTRLGGVLNTELSVKGNVGDLEKKQYNNFYAAGNLDIDNFNYVSKDYPDGVTISAFRSNFTPSKIDVPKLTGEFKKTTFNATGKINNLMSYLFAGKALDADLTLNAGKINLNDWMGLTGDTSTSSATADVFIVPSNLRVTLNTKADEVNYDNLVIKNLAGAVRVDDQTVKLSNIHGDALGGQISIAGSYSTKQDKQHPEIEMSYTIDKVDIEKTFTTFNTAQKLMPIGKFLSGKLSSSLTAKGKLGKDMDVDLNSLSGAGDLFVLEGVLNKFAPLEEIASKLNVSQLQSISLKDVKAFFEFANGKVMVKPFTTKIKDIEMEIGGLQGLDESLDYAVNMKLPRALLGSQGNQLVDNLASAAALKGINLNPGEMINLKLNLGGTLKNPKVSVGLKQVGETLAEQMKDQAKEFAQSKIESTKAAVQDSLQSLKEQATSAAKEEIAKRFLGKGDSEDNKNDSTGGVENITEKARESAKGLLKNILKKKDETDNK